MGNAGDDADSTNYIEGPAMINYIYMFLVCLQRVFVLINLSHVKPMWTSVIITECIYFYHGNVRLHILCYKKDYGGVELNHRPTHHYSWKILSYPGGHCPPPHMWGESHREIHTSMWEKRAIPSRVRRV